MGDLYIPDVWRFASLIVAVVVLVWMVVRQLVSTRARWKRLDAGHAALGLTLTESRGQWEVQREQWGKTFARWQVGHIERKRADLAVLQQKPEDYAFQRVVTALGAASVAVALVVMAAIFLGLSPGLMTWMVAALVPVLFYGFVSPADVSRKADERRTQVSFEFAQYLQLVVMFIKGGREWGLALRMASRIAKEPTFQAIALFLERGIDVNETPSQVFHNLGTFWHHEDIVRFASTIRASEAGGTMKDAVVSQCESITERNLHTLLEQADRATQRAGLPETGIVAIYMLYLMYPSLAQI